MTTRSCTVTVALAAIALIAPLSAQSAETWMVEGGRTTLHLDTDRLAALGLELVDVLETADRPASDVVMMETPVASFAIVGSSLELRADHGVVLSDGSTTGGLRHLGGFAIRDIESGAIADFSDFRIDAIGESGDLYLSDATGELSFALEQGALRLDAASRAITSNHLELTVSPEWARRIARPDLAGSAFGLAYIQGQARHVEGASIGDAPTQNLGGIRDVKLGELYGIGVAGRVGSYPNGTNGLSMATTSCNVGTEDIQWFAPMSEDHPSIAMHLYREQDGKFEQIGVSWLKHGFFALSSSQCTPCQNPSGGDFLGVGCSDTYGFGNNNNRRWLGPRDEWDPYAGTWECTGSFFSGYQPDCNRRDDGSGYNGYEHRLEVDDYELDNANATYIYEAYYVVRDEDEKFNNWGWRDCTMSWNGSSWNFNTTGGGLSPTEGPALYTWGDMHTVASIGPNDGNFLVATKVTDLGGGMWRYDYNVLNEDSDREAFRFSVPLDGASATNIEFNDWDEVANDWTTTVNASSITWETDSYDVDPDANAIVFGYMYSFRFDSDTPPIDTNVTLDMFKPGPDGDQILVRAKAPGTLVATGEASVTPTAARLLAARPNPAVRGTSIPFVVESPATVEIGVFDASGRRVRELLDSRMSVGSHDVAWDATDAAGRRVAAGVYYVRMAIDRELVSSRSIVVVD